MYLDSGKLVIHALMGPWVLGDSKNIYLNKPTLFSTVFKPFSKMEGLKKKKEQAGTELCQAQGKFKLICFGSSGLICFVW